ncbi:MAG: hypothetical protein J5985_00560 [Kiritimatiellae bacterium]|nr:hypothetical protein [Kiritimatiellia bacterium]
MKLELIGAMPLATGPDGRLLSHIGTYFVKTRTLVSLPKMPHAFQQIKYREILNERRKAAQEPPLTEAEWSAISESAVDLIMRLPDVLIRPVPQQMDLAFIADEALQEIVPKHHIRFLRAQDPLVQQAVRERGEYWRISFAPTSSTMIVREIQNSLVAIGGRPIYYYNPANGSRYLTVEKFTELGKLPPGALRQHLCEIKEYSARRNRGFFWEIDFFAADGDSLRKSLAAFAFDTLPDDALFEAYREILRCFAEQVPDVLRKDDPENPEWRRRMFSCIANSQADVLSDTMVNGLSPEFFRQILWHPGARVENGVLVFDSIFEYAKQHPEDTSLAGLCDERVKGFICNFMRDLGTLQYVNIGGILPGMRRKAPVGGHRSYLAEVMYKDAPAPVLRILRIQRWGVCEHLDEGKDLLRALMETLDYTEYTKNRRLGCWELGMPIPVNQTQHMLGESYSGRQTKYHTTPVWTVYYMRDFIEGTATDKVPDADLKNRAFALRFAKLLGDAAAPNIVVGRIDGEGGVTYDCGDEILVPGRDGLPEKLLVADHTGTFGDVEHPFEFFVEGYARPVVSRWDRVADPEAFLETYLESFASRLFAMKTARRLHPHVFDALFQHSRQGKGTFADRWSKALKRLEETDISSFIASLRTFIGEYVKTR